MISREIGGLDAQPELSERELQNSQANGSSAREIGNREDPLHPVVHSEKTT